MKSCISVSLPTTEEWFTQSIKIGMDKEWRHKRKKFPETAKGKGVYILYTKNPKQILYVGKTAGKTMDFATRLYRHATKAASRNSTVYRELKDMKKCIHAALVDVERIKTFFIGKRLRNSGYIDVFEQMAIHCLHPKLQLNKE
jgi:hypothetical protein